jgi:hypothetical protein
MTGFTEASSLERGFAAVYDNELAPKLQALAADRSGLRHSTRRDIALIGGAGVLGAALIPILSDEPLFVSLIPLVIAGIAAFFLVHRRRKAWEQSVIDAVMPTFCAFLGDLRYDRDGPGRAFVTRFETLGLVGESNIKTLRHGLSGHHRDTAFELAQAELAHRTTGKNSSTIPVFDGLLFRIAVPTSVPTPIVIMPNHSLSMEKVSGYLGLSGTEGATAMTTGNSEFDKRFKISCDDPEFARSFLTPPFQEALVEIDDRERPSHRGLAAVRAAFDVDTFYLALSRHQQVMVLGPIRFEQPKPFLKVGSLMAADIDLRDSIHGLFEDVSLVYRIIDILHGQSPRARG